MSGRQYINQGILEHAIRDIFPLDNIVFNARKDSNIANPTTGRYFELDAWIPQHDIGFEFQDMHHYITKWYYHKSLDVIAKHDDSKRKEVNENGSTLVIVPFWWDGSNESLQATISFERPDLSINGVSGVPLSLNPPLEYFESPSVPGVGELMHASFVQDINEMGNRWWIGEKYDGIRGCWNPNSREIYSRLGMILNFPFRVHLPKVFIESEIWFGRGNFYDARSSLSDSKPIWSFVRMIAFDNPDPNIHTIQFEKRYAQLLSTISPVHQFLIVATRMKYKSKYHISYLLEHVIDDGGEGVILRRQQSIYQSGRSDLLWKLKATRGDHEALVVNAAPDSTFTLQLPDGITFEVPRQKCADAIPKKGEIVTFTYENYSKRSVPVDPRIVRVRTDLTWRDVVRQYFQEAIANAPKKEQKIPYGYWAAEKRQKNKRKFFEDFAKRNALDPLVPDSWYDASAKFLQEKGAKHLVYPEYRSFARAVMDVFQEIGLQENKFKVLPRGYWDRLPHRRECFNSIAAQHQFDPLVPANWYSLPFSLFSSKEASIVLSYYNNNVPLALESLYPEISVDKTKFNIDFPVDYWADANNRRNFFIIFANEKRFDPLIPENWYSLNVNDILRCKFPQGAESVFAFYGNSLSSALRNLFPHVEFKTSKFLTLPDKYWYPVSNRRKFFTDYATTHGFSVDSIQDWYLVAPPMLYDFPGAKTLLAQYEGSIAKALSHLFPHLNMDRSHFMTESEYWQNEKNQREFLIQYAKKRNFDPLLASDWYSASSSDLKAIYGGSKVLNQYNGSKRHALHNIFPNLKNNFKKTKN